MKSTAWMSACRAALMSYFRSRNGPHARIVDEFFVELPNLLLALGPSDEQATEYREKVQRLKKSSVLSTDGTKWVRCL